MLSPLTAEEAGLPSDHFLVKERQYRCLSMFIDVMADVSWKPKGLFCYVFKLGRVVWCA